MEKETTDVLVVGGSLVGLSSAVFLAAKGVKVVLVEPHLGSHPHPRAVGYTQRTMELFRAAGLGSVIPEVPKGFRLKRAVVECLAGEWRQDTEWTPQQAGALAPELEYSPHTGAAIAQDLLEPKLRARARELGAELRLGSSMTRFVQDAEGVTAVITEKGGRAYEVRAKYLVAADGTKSGVREALGISRRGPGPLQTVHSVLFRAELEEYLTTEIRQFEIEQPGLRAFLTTYGEKRWVLMFLDERERNEAELREAITLATGRPDVPVEIITTGRWELSALIANQFSKGRVFLVGDAAHTLPPTRGGYGANTGIADAHNLAWKLAAVLKGESSPGLLDTYDAERNPVAWTRLEQTFARPDYARYAKGFEAVPLFDDAAMEFGQLYRSAGIIGADASLPAAARPEVWAGQPGTRAPHAMMNGASTLDLFGDGWVLVAPDARWADAAKGLPIRFEPLTADVARVFGLSAHAASLVRPDGVVAWRSEDASALPEAFTRVSFVP